MSKNHSIVFVAMTVLTLCLISCGSSQLPPLDDAYYWPDKRQAAVSAVQSAPVQLETTGEAQNTPKIEFINVQDTTVTVKIKR